MSVAIATFAKYLKSCFLAGTSTLEVFIIIIININIIIIIIIITIIIIMFFSIIYYF